MWLESILPIPPCQKIMDFGSLLWVLKNFDNTIVEAFRVVNCVRRGESSWGAQGEADL